MTFSAVQCPHCQSEQMVKREKTRRGIQRSLGQNTACATGSVLLDSRHRGCLPEVKHTIMDMRLNTNGVRDTARVLRIRTDTVLSELKKQAAALESVNTALLRTLHPDGVTVAIERAGEAERDAMWSFVGSKQDQRWLGHAIDHATGAVVAYVFGRRKDAVFLPWKALLEPCGLTRFPMDHWGASTRHLDTDVHSPSPRTTQKIERTHLPLRTRRKGWARRTLCFPQTTQMPDIVLDVFVNRYAFGRTVSTWPSPL